MYFVCLLFLRNDENIKQWQMLADSITARIQQAVKGSIPANIASRKSSTSYRPIHAILEDVVSRFTWVFFETAVEVKLVRKFHKVRGQNVFVLIGRVNVIWFLIIRLMPISQFLNVSQMHYCLINGTGFNSLNDNRFLSGLTYPWKDIDSEWLIYLLETWHYTEFLPVCNSLSANAKA